MKKRDLINIFATINTLGNVIGGKFGYAMAKNLNLIKGEVEALEKAREFTPEFKEYDAKRIKLAEELATQKDGKPMKQPSSSNPQMEEYVLSAKAQKEFDKGLEKLKDEYKDAISGMEKRFEDYAKLLEEDIEIAFFPHKVNLADVPNTLSVKQMNGIFPLIESV